MHKFTVTSRGRTTLPKAVRKALRLSAGSRIRYDIRPDGEVRILKVGSIRQLKGAFASKCKKAVSLAEMDAAIAHVAFRQGL